MAEGGHTSGRFVPGAVLGGKYVLRDRIGAGGAGEVWSAVNRGTRGTVALKIILSGTSASDATARFRHEASLSASLTHRNIVRVFDLLEEPDGTLALVMEYLRGENARDRLLRTGLLPTSPAVSIATQILSALSHAHAHGIVHRDIKPPNLFLATEPDGSITPKLLDFGIAKTAISSLHTSHGQLLGTPRYMSPEQIRAESIDGRSDLFSVAVVLYELITGRCPFAAGFATASLAAVLETRVARDPLISEALWRVMDRALTKDRNDRYDSADDFAAALREAIEHKQGSLSRLLVRSKPPPPLALDIPGIDIKGADGDVAAPVDLPSARRPHARAVVLGLLGIACVLSLAGGVRTLTSRARATQTARSTAPARAAALAPPPVDHVAAAQSPVVVPPAANASARANETDETPSRVTTMPRASAVRASTLMKPAKVTATAPTEAATSMKPQSSERIVKDPGF